MVRFSSCQSIGALLERSLSVLLPVHNAQSSLAATVQQFLEVLPDLTKTFEVIIVDDGSADATIEVADDLARCYPQVKACRHAAPRGRVAAIQTAFERSKGDVLLLKDDACPLPIHQIGRLWWALKEHDVVLGRAGACGPLRPARSGPEEKVPGAVQMVSRRAIESILRLLSDQARLRAALSKGGYSWREIDIGGRGRARAWARQLLARGSSRADSIGRERCPPDGRSGPRRPNYLTRLKGFALGE